MSYVNTRQAVKMLGIHELITTKSISRIVVAHKDRLARFGFEMFKLFCEQFNVEIVVLNQTSLSPEEELVNDITSIIHVFSSRLHGLRRYSVKVEEDKSVSNDGTEREIEEDVWDVEIHV